MIQDRLRCPAGHTDKAVDGWTFSWKWLDRWRDGWTNGHRDGWTGRHRQGHVQLDIRTVLCMDTMAGYTHRQTEGPHVHTHSRSSRTDNCMSSQTHGHYTCGWTDTCPARPFSSPPMHINALKMHFFAPKAPLQNQRFHILALPPPYSPLSMDLESALDWTLPPLPEPGLGDRPRQTDTRCGGRAEI